jgi:hypothetical protein
MSREYIIYPLVKQLWPPEGDSRVTNMDVVFFSDLEDGTREVFRKPGETWVQKGHPEVCWPEEWLPEDLDSNVRIFEIRPTSTVVVDRRVDEAAMRALHRLADDRALDRLAHDRALRRLAHDRALRRLADDRWVDEAAMRALDRVAEVR